MNGAIFPALFRARSRPPLGKTCVPATRRNPAAARGIRSDTYLYIYTLLYCIHMGIIVFFSISPLSSQALRTRLAHRRRACSAPVEPHVHSTDDIIIITFQSRVPINICNPIHAHNYVTSLHLIYIYIYK